MSTQTVELLPRQAIRASVGTFFFIQGLCFASWASRIPDIQARLHLSEAQLGGVLLALPAGLMTSLPVVGWLVGRYGSRRAMIVAAILYASTLPLIGWVGLPWHLAGVLFLYGMWGNLANIAINTQAVGTEVLYGRSIMASFHGLWSLAGLAGAAVGTLLIRLDISPFVHFCLVSAVAYGLVVAAYPYALPQDTGGDGARPLFVRPDRQLLLMGLIAFCTMICEGTMFDWSGVYFHKVVNAPREWTTLGYVAFMGTMAGGRFVGDWLAFRVGVKRLIGLNGALIATGLFTAVLFPYLIPATVGFLLVGMGVSTIVPLVYGAAGRSGIMSTGAALAAVSSIGFLGFLLGPPLIGFIAQAASLRWSFAAVALLGLGTIFLVRQVRMEN
ncbi:MAG: MFS transporter [Ferruginibacter sp.]|nr:MFS transporter [Cytophagales bacterium]